MKLFPNQRVANLGFNTSEQNLEATSGTDTAKIRVAQACSLQESKHNLGYLSAAKMPNPQKGSDSHSAVPPWTDLTKKASGA